MTTLDDHDLFTETTATPTGARPRPHRHEWERLDVSLDPGAHIRGCLMHVHPTQRTADRIYVCTCISKPRAACSRCGKVRDEAAARRGRNNRLRGNAKQRERIAALGGRNLAGNNPNLDGLGLLFRYESKSGGAFSERYWRWVTGIPIEANQTPVLIVTEAPGRGRKARSYVVVPFDEWRALHGETTP